MTPAPDEPEKPRRLVWLATIPLVAAFALAVVLVVLALDNPAGVAAAPGTEPPASAAQPTAPPTPTPTPTSVPAGAEGDLPPGADAPGDTPVVPDADLPQAEVDALLRVPATGPADGGACKADEVGYELTGFDAALGHRYATLVVRNVSARECTVSGYPGIGGRGTWGNGFRFEAEQRPINGEGEETPAVPLAPGAAAHAWLEWTGALAGADQEQLSSFAFQLAAGEPATLYRATYPDGDPLDVGMQSTVRIGPLRPAA